MSCWFWINHIFSCEQINNVFLLYYVKSFICSGNFFSKKLMQITKIVYREFVTEGGDDVVDQLDVTNGGYYVVDINNVRVVPEKE